MDRPVLVLSRGLVVALSEDELDAVLAHELAHLVNDDLRLITWALMPVVAAELLFDDTEYQDEVDVIGQVLALAGSVGLGVFSRGREMAADRGAALATGDPATLAAALERLSESAPARPNEDLRGHARSTNAINVLPTLGPDRDAHGLFATHPPLEARLDQLCSLTREGQ